MREEEVDRTADVLIMWNPASVMRLDSFRPT
jgi:hypothetical protein